MLPFTTRRRRACPARTDGPAQKGKRLANLSKVLTGPGHDLAARHRAGLVWGRRARHRDQQRHRRLTPSRSDPPEGCPAKLTWAGCPSSRYGGSLSETLQASSIRKPCSAPIKPTNPSRSCAGSSSAGRSVEPGLGSTGGHVSGSARPPRRGNAAPVVGQGHCPHDALLARTVLLCHPARPATRAPDPPGHSHQRLVSQAAPNLLRHARRRAPRNLARTGFRHVPHIAKHAETPASPPGCHHLCSLPCRRWPKSS